MPHAGNSGWQIRIRHIMEYFWVSCFGQTVEINWDYLDRERSGKAYDPEKVIWS
jgi:hypothetical protein